MVKYYFIPIIALLMSGCFSTTKVNTVYPFEGRYNDKTKLTIDDQKVNIPKGKSVWILTNDTLFNLLDNSKGK